MTPLILSLSLLACSGKSDDTGSPGDPQADDTAADDTGTTAGDDTGPGGDDTGATDDTGEPPDPADYVTYGPALPDCTPEFGDGDRVALSGVVLAPEGPEAGLVVYSRSSGEIACVGAGCDTAGADVICTEGVISPGLLNAHDHMQYNVLYPWRHDELYEDRYDWQSDGDYYEYREAYDDMEGAYGCEIMKWAELRNLVAGATAVVGSSGDDDCIGILMRNLDEGPAAHGLDDYELYYSAGRVTSRDEGDGQWWQDELASGGFECVLNHVAEGINGSVTAEIDHMFDIGGSGEGFGYVHATDATTDQLAHMSEEGTTILWSPRSNLDLYAATTPATLALTLGVPLVIAPDWTWSGSTDPRREMVCVDEFLWATGAPLTDRQIWAAVTSDAAKILGVVGTLGSLEAGAKADIAVYTYSDTPYRAVIDAGPTDTRLVVVDGLGLYGHPELVSPLAENPDWCESFSACGDPRTLCVKAGESGDDATTYAELEAALSAALDATSMPADLDYANDLFPILMCEDEREACDPTAVTADDTDGDGVADGADVCPGIYDPLQWDYDMDGQGDFCDPCPLNPVAEVCDHDPDDIDGDGFPHDVDTCPHLYDPDQLDSDGDDKGDACDVCPEAYNPGTAGCPFTVDTISDESHPDHPPEGTSVTLSGLVVTGIASNGYFAQDAALSEYAGIWVYDYGWAAGDGLEVGDEITVVGDYVEYNGLAEIFEGETTVTGAGSISPLAVATCSVGTGGANAERYESMLVEVEEVAVSDSNPDDPDDYGAFVVDDCLWVDDVLSSDYETHPPVGTEYASITGPLTFAYDENRILPRGAEDLQE